MAAEREKANAARDLLLGDDASQQAEFILNLIEQAAEGRELQNVISDVIQVCSERMHAIESLYAF